MSIIYNTIERLEKETTSSHVKFKPAPVNDLPANKHTPKVKLLGLALLVSFTVFLLWQNIQKNTALSSEQFAVNTPAGVTEALIKPEVEQIKHQEQAKESVPVIDDSISEQSVLEQTSQVKLTVLNPEPKVASTDNSKAEAKAVAKAKPKPVVATSSPKELPVASEASVVSQFKRVDVSLEQAQVSLSKGQYFQALSTLSGINPVPNNRADFWFIKGSVHLGLGELENADKAFSRAQILAPKSAQIAVQRAILKQEQGDHHSALFILDDAAKLHPTIPEIFLNLGYSQQAIDQSLEAVRSFNVFLKLTEGRSLYLDQRAVVKQWVDTFTSLQS